MKISNFQQKNQYLPFNLFSNVKIYAYKFYKYVTYLQLIYKMIKILVSLI